MGQEISFASVGIQVIEHNLRSGTATLVYANGSFREIPMPLDLDDNPIVSSMFFVESHQLILETRAGETIRVDLPRHNGVSPTGDRPVIYLDQKDWSLLANRIYRPDLLSGAEHAAAECLIDLGLGGKIILPLSPAHMSETCKWTNNERRYQLGLTILQLSAGWQMRPPEKIRGAELRQSLARRYLGAIPVSLDVFTLEPMAIYPTLQGTLSVNPERLPPDVRLATRAITAITSVFSSMLDDEPVPYEIPPGWVESRQCATDWMAGQTHESTLKRLRTDTFFFADSRREIATAAIAAGLKLEDLEDWAHGPWTSDVQEMPALGLFRELLHDKTLLPATKWEQNDLTDMMFLTAAAGYADFVVGEKSAVSLIKQGAARIKRDICLYKNIVDLVTSGVLDNLN